MYQYGLISAVIRRNCQVIRRVAFFAMDGIEGLVVPKYRYLAILQSSNCFEAWQDCSSEGGHLASIASRQEQALVEEAMSKARNEKAVFYIGSV
uniref:Uncharacterized protein n=1 Tax=Anopheles christyi TaxID=43041 RepID=A0A182KA08_9DIPT